MRDHISEETHGLGGAWQFVELAKIVLDSSTLQDPQEEVEGDNATSLQDKGDRCPPEPDPREVAVYGKINADRRWIKVVADMISASTHDQDFSAYRNQAKKKDLDVALDREVLIRDIEV